MAVEMMVVMVLLVETVLLLLSGLVKQLLKR